MLQILDVSGNQDARFCDYRKVKDTGVAGVVPKATEGINYEDGCYREHCKRVRDQGLGLGAYHYLRVRTGKPQDAELQAEQFCERYFREKCNLTPWLDCEDTNNETARPEEWVEAITRFLDTAAFWLDELPDLYTYPGFWTSKRLLRELPRAGECRLIIAHYALPGPGVPIVPAPWKDWFGWQYAASAGVFGKCEGIPGWVDRSVYRVDSLAPLVKGYRKG